MIATTIDTIETAAGRYPNSEQPRQRAAEHWQQVLERAEQRRRLMIWARERGYAMPERRR